VKRSKKLKGNNKNVKLNELINLGESAAFGWWGW